MSKLHGICIPYPSELVESILGRTGFKIGLSRKELRNIIIDKRNQNYSEIPYISLNSIANHYVSITGEDLLINHTTFIYDTFFSDTRSRENSKNKYLKGSKNLSQYLNRNYYCPKCAKADRDQTGESWLKIENNLIGLPFCYKCGSILAQVDQSIDRYPTLDAIEVDNYGNEFPNFSPVLMMATEIARNKYEAFEFCDARNRVRELIIRKYTYKKKKFILQEFIKDMISFYFNGKEEKFEKISGININYYVSKIENIFYLKSSNNNLTTAFLMVIYFLNISFHDFWMIEPHVELIHNQSAIIPTGLAARIIVETLITENEAISLSRFLQLYPGLYKFLMNNDKEWLLARLPKKSHCFVDKGTLERVKSKVRALIDEERNFDLKMLRTEYGAQYSYLIRNDPGWLKKELPSINKQERLINVKEMVEQLIKEKPGYALAEFINDHKTAYSYLRRNDPEWLKSKLGARLTPKEKLVEVKSDVELLIRENEGLTLNDLIRNHNKLYSYLWIYDPNWMYERLPSNTDQSIKITKVAIERKDNTKLDEVKEKVVLLKVQNSSFSLTDLINKHSHLYNFLRVHDPNWLYEALPRGAYKQIKLTDAKKKVEQLISEKNICSMKDLKNKDYSLYCYIDRNDSDWLHKRFPRKNNKQHTLKSYKKKVKQMMLNNKRFSLRDLIIQDKTAYSYLYKNDPEWLYSTLPRDGYREKKLLLAKDQVESLAARDKKFDLRKLRADHKRLYNNLYSHDRDWLFQRFPKNSNARDTISDAKLKLEDLITGDPSFCLRTLRNENRTLYGFLLKKDPEWLNQRLPVINVDINRFLSKEDKQEQILSLFVEVYNDAIDNNSRISQGTFKRNPLTRKYYAKLNKYSKVQEFVQSVCETYENWCKRIIPRFINRMIVEKYEPITFLEFCKLLKISNSSYPYSSEIGKVAARTIYEYFQSNDIDNTYIGLPSVFLKNMSNI